MWSWGGTPPANSWRVGRPGPPHAPHTHGHLRLGTAALPSVRAPLPQHHRSATLLHHVPAGGLLHMYSSLVYV